MNTSPWYHQYGYPTSSAAIWWTSASQRSIGISLYSFYSLVIHLSHVSGSVPLPPSTHHLFLHLHCLVCWSTSNKPPHFPPTGTLYRYFIYTSRFVFLHTLELPSLIGWCVLLFHIICSMWYWSVEVFLSLPFNIFSVNYDIRNPIFHHNLYLSVQFSDIFDNYKLFYGVLYTYSYVPIFSNSS